MADPVTKYVPELADRDPRFTRITIRDLLTMSSGIEYTEEGLPWSGDALTYYGTDLRELALTRTHIAEPPGRTWRYDNYGPLLLGLVLERAIKTPVAVYMSKWLWQPLGAEADATWSLESSQGRCSSRRRPRAVLRNREVRTDDRRLPGRGHGHRPPWNDHRRGRLAGAAA